MSKKAKDIVEKFYQSEFFKDDKILKDFLHTDVELSWYGTTGFRKLDLEGIAEIGQQLNQSFDSLRLEVEKVIAKKDDVAIHFTYHVRTIENPEEEMPYAHFIAMWQLKDDKLCKGVQISQLGEEIEKSPWAK